MASRGKVVLHPSMVGVERNKSVVRWRRKPIRTIDAPTLYVTNMAFGRGGAETVCVTRACDQWKPPFPGAVYRWTR